MKNRSGFDSVITSYSIHYTKLYDINNYSSYDVVRFIEDFNCLSTSENEEDESYYASMIAIRYTNKWFRTFFYEKGMDGVEGF